jgi:flagellar basal-body rod protein FlgG
MMRALSTAASGMEAEQTRLDVTANNIANVATAGFKKSRAEFEDIMYDVQRAAGSATSATTSTPSGIEIGMGVRTAGTARSHEQGEMKQTGNSLDVAIEGAGFFAVRLPSGQTAYSRDGSLKTDVEGRLVTREGHQLASEVIIPPDATSVSIAADGTVSAMVPGQTEPVDAGQIRISAFANPAGLEGVGHNLFHETVASGAALNGAPGENGTGSLVQGSLELSNVKIVEEMIELIAGQRAYEVNSRVIRAADEMLQQTAQLR